MGINGLANGYPQLQAYLDQNLINGSAAAFKKPLTQTVDAAIVKNVLNETGIMGRHGTPQMPLFIYKAVADEVSPVADTDAFGARIQYTRDLVGEHVTDAITGSGDALSFIKARFNSVPAAAGCKTNTVITDLADAGALAGLSSSLVGALLAFLQIPIGASRLPSVIGSFFL
ncbi:secretory lipase-like protein 1 precursor [Aureobasidium subglaciale]|nr:secretory lipase-like protein 1 precursor [Aureobasidium subglaciale]KAI5226163.1 secretory lipase-like protein 1 precursor [Aureobasidium subglaciale]KAI5229465.1 secretory lipase-like protein 1 precursor [Aureobasidium subglaciale]KAI5264188.1 secretory lipase-like protein 1 precursor [Aureobasidium subglaciale]